MFVSKKSQSKLYASASSRSLHHGHGANNSTSSRMIGGTLLLMVMLVIPLLSQISILFNLDSRNKDDTTAAICAIQKWGLSYIDEWVDYHIALGFQTIFIYDNSDDFELLGWYSNKFQDGTDRVKIFHWPGEVQQLPVYNKCMSYIKHRQYHSWIAFIDLDEFVVIKDTEKFPLIIDFLESIPQDAGGLSVNWQMFDWNNQTQYEAKPLSLRFNRFEKNLHVKTIARTDRVNRMASPHVAIYTKAFTSVDTDGETVEGPFNDRMPTNDLAINHYHTKSLEEYKLRCKRGRADIKGMEGQQACKLEKDILADWGGSRDFHFDDSVWKFLKERVPTYSKYEHYTDVSDQDQVSKQIAQYHAQNG